MSHVTAAAGGITIAEEALARMVAATTAFQELTNSDSATEALQHIYYHALPRPENGASHTLAELQAYRPFAIIFTFPFRGFKWTKTANYSFPVSGSLGLHLEQNVEEDLKYDNQELMRQWLNVMSRMICGADGADDDGILNLRGDTYLDDINDVWFVEADRSDQQKKTTDGDFLSAFFLIEWGRR